MESSWSATREMGTVGELHDRDRLSLASRGVHRMEPTGDALVLGSTQAVALVHRSHRVGPDLEIVRRSTGGGSVLLVRGDVLWVDVVVPAGDPLWCDDIGRSFEWLGQAWVAALNLCGVRAEAHRGATIRGRWGGLACFAGISSGEVTVREKKVVGLSQRRTREGARFQAIVHRRFDPRRLAGLLELMPDDRASLTRALNRSAGCVDVNPNVLFDALLDRLPA